MKINDTHNNEILLTSHSFHLKSIPCISQTALDQSLDSL